MGAAVEVPGVAAVAVGGHQLPGYVLAAGQRVEVQAGELGLAVGGGQLLIGLPEQPGQLRPPAVRPLLAS